MKINTNQIITGIFVYDSSCAYTVNDFVIKDGVIYICNKDSQGKDPETSDSFTIYLGDRCTDLQEYLDFLDTAEGDNKYVSVEMLQAILSAYLTGPTGKGIIGDYICYDNNNNLEVSLRVSDEGTFTNPETVITDIMFHPDINHALFRVSRLLPEIYGYVGNPGISDYSGEDEKSCILRQYTYIQEDTEEKIRLQELIDPVDGLIWYRSGNLEGDYNSSKGAWKCSIMNSKALKEKVENIINSYSSRISILKSLESHLKSNFRFRKIDVSDKSTSVYIDKNKNDVTNKELTIVLSTETSTGIVKNQETSINLADKLDDKIPKYQVGDNLLLSFETTFIGNRIDLTNTSGETPSNSWISEIYYKEYYGLS